MQVTPKINLQEFAFIDIGSGKGRALLLASQYPFQRILGIELLAELASRGEREYQQIQKRFAAVLRHRMRTRRCFRIRLSRRADGTVLI